jgi:hypothetical protein
MLQLNHMSDKQVQESKTQYLYKFTSKKKKKKKNCHTALKLLAVI